MLLLAKSPWLTPGSFSVPWKPTSQSAAATIRAARSSTVADRGGRRRGSRGRCRDLHRTAGTAVLNQRVQLLLRVAVGLRHAGRHDQRHRLLDGDVELDDLAARGIEEEPGGRVWRARQEAGDIVLARQPRCNVRARRRGE